MPIPTELAEGVRLRPLLLEDAGALADAYARNRGHLAPWEPIRPEDHYAEIGQAQRVADLLNEVDAGRHLALALTAGDLIVGTVNLSNIVRGPLLSGSLGYWIDADHQGRRLATKAVAATIEHARDDLGLHRLEAGTLLHNTGSQRVLLANGFVEIGVAREYLLIEGRWQDHRLFQRLLTS